MTGDPNNDPRLRFHRWVVAVVFLVATITLSFMPSGFKHMLHTHGHFHGVGHVMVFGVLTLTLLRVVNSSRSRVYVIAFAMAVGFIIEGIQPLVLSGAVLEPLDMGFDFMGVVFATLLNRTLRNLRTMPGRAEL